VPSSTAAAMRREVCAMSLFKKATAVKKAEPAKKAKGIAWLVGDPLQDAVAKAVKAIVGISAEQKALEAKMEVHKTVVKKYAHDNFVGDFTRDGVLPETPMKVQTADGEAVTYVVQDRSSQYKVSEEQQEALCELLGADAVPDLLYTEYTFKFNRQIMAIPGVQEAIDKALSSAVTKLVKGGELTEEQGDSLIEADERTTFRPGTLDRVPQIVGSDTNRVRQFIEIMGSCCTRYVKA